VVELNDGTMSGISGNDPHVLYSNLKKCFAGDVKEEK
jgi:hypothetical protein